MVDEKNRKASTCVLNSDFEESGKDIFFSVFRLKLLPLHPKIWLI